jgi:uncharacterized membrane protein
MESFVSVLSGKEFPLSERIHIGAVRANIYALMFRENPKLSGEGYISLRELATYREQYITDVLSKQIGQIGEVQRTVIDALENETLLSEKLAIGDDTKLTRAQRLADGVASFGGSWTFISAFGVFIFCWITLNIYFLRNVGYDPYPFILLNLILSCVAALQAPIIMMSQNRQEEKDRERAKKDYMINLKSEMEIRILHEKLDHLILHQQQELLEIQRMQMEMMDDILESVNKNSEGKAAN